jgi:hypothetical protein
LGGSWAELDTSYSNPEGMTKIDMATGKAPKTSESTGYWRSSQAMAKLKRSSWRPPGFDAETA